MLTTIDVTLQIASLYAIGAIAVALAFRVIGFPDLTPDGSFTFGASISAALLLAGVPEIGATSVAVLGGALAGVGTALMHTRLGVSKLLSGILMMLTLYSLSLRVMGTSNLSLMKISTVLGSLSDKPGSPVAVLTTATLCFAVFILIWAMLRTQLGLRLRAAGDSGTALDFRNISEETCYFIGLAISNGLASLAGAMVSSYQGFVDASMGTGLVVTSLTSIVIGEILMRPERVTSLLLCPIVGMVVYQAIVAAALRLGLPPSDLKIGTAFLALSLIVMDCVRRRRGTFDRQIGNRSF